MTMYFFYQRSSKEPWEVALATDRAKIANSVMPELTTALDVDNAFDEDLTAEDYDQLKYSGDMYYDFDADDISDSIAAFKQFLVNFEAKGVNLKALKLFASGGKGFHCIVPWEMLMSRMPAQGIQHLPAIYREVAFSAYVDCMDMRVYSAKRGRQFRCPNIQRESGTYKVSISVDEALGMTPELYSQLCSAPRNFVGTEDPTLDSYLALTYSKAKDKVERSTKGRKANRDDKKLFDRFKGDMPVEMVTLFEPDLVQPNVGWNKVCMQYALLASAAGIKEDVFIDQCQPLIMGYTGDSARYGSPQKRERALLDMIRYVSDNPCYSFSLGGLSNVLTHGADLSWLGGAPADNLASQASQENAGAATQEDPSGEGQGEVEKPPQEPRVWFTQTGIMAKAEEGFKSLSDLVVLEATKVEDVTLDQGETGRGMQLIGYDLKVRANGNHVSVSTLPMSKLMGRQQFQSWTYQWGIGYRGSDTETSLIADALRYKTMGKTIYVVKGEGLDLVVNPKDPGSYDIVYSSPAGVVSTSGVDYTFRPTYESRGMFASDLLRAEDLTAEDEKLVESLLNINAPANVAKLLGWFTASHFCPLIRRKYGGKFPILQVFGQAGAGKSETVKALVHLHYYLAEPRIMSAVGQTQFPIVCALSASSSIPIIFEEVKPREMTKGVHDFMLNVFRCNYNAMTFSRGGLSRDSANKEVVVNDIQNRAPLVFVGEALEEQTAIMERCIMVNLSKSSRAGRREDFSYVNSQVSGLGRIGKKIMHYVMSADLDAFYEAFDNIHADVRQALGDQVDMSDRPIFNMAVAIMGLKVLENVLSRVFGDKFQAKFETFRGVLLNNMAEHIPVVISEASKVLSVMADLSYSNNPELRLVNGEDYTVAGGGDTATVDVKLKSSFEKYVKYCRTLGYTPLYDSPAAFITAMGTYHALLDKTCFDNQVLEPSLFNKVYRFSTKLMGDEEVRPFNPAI